MKIVRDKRVDIHVNGPELAQKLGMRGRSSVRFPSGADFKHRRPYRAAHRAFDEGQALVMDQHGARE